jgi:hypothetical protein
MEIVNELVRGEPPVSDENTFKTYENMRTAISLDDVVDVDTPQGRAKQLYQKLSTGQTNFYSWVPTLRKTTWFNATGTHPAAANIGNIDNPNAPVTQTNAPSTDDYDYLKISDSTIRQQGEKGQRVEEWEGAGPKDVTHDGFEGGWDEDLYYITGD